MRIYNTMTRKKEELVPVTPGEVRIYSCGPTVYNFFHIGNARPFIVFDTLRRYLEYRGYRVKFVQNFTDIDDKMINRAKEEGVTVKELADRFIEEYYKDADALGIERATVNPRATEHIDDIIELISELIEKGHAYVAENGDVYYSTHSFPNTASFPARRSKIWKRGRALRSASRKRIPPTLRCGRPISPANLAGTARGARAAPAGTSSVRP